MNGFWLFGYLVRSVPSSSPADPIRRIGAFRAAFLCRVGAPRSIGRGPAEAGLSGVYEWFLVVRVSGAFLSVCTASRFIHYTTAVVALPGLFRCTCRSCERPRQFPWASPGA